MSPPILSSHEKRFLRRLAAGKTDAEIARYLGGNARHVAEQRARLLEKLGINEPAQIAEAAERLASWSTYRGIT